MVAALNVEGVGIVGSRLLFPDGTLQHDGVGVGSNGPLHLRRGEQPGLFPLSLTYPIAVTGALMTIRRQVFDDLNGFDTSYPFGLEDIDFCHRARQKGWRAACTHKYPSLHLEATTPGRIEMDIESRALYMERWADKVPPNTRDDE
jgi:GT2 family glycosyltransferase